MLPSRMLRQKANKTLSSTLLISDELDREIFFNRFGAAQAVMVMVVVGVCSRAEQQQCILNRDVLFSQF